MKFALGIIFSVFTQNITLEQDAHPITQSTEHRFTCKNDSYMILYKSSFGKGSSLSELDKSGSRIEGRGFQSLSAALHSVYLPQITIMCPNNGIVKILVSGASAEKSDFGLEKNILVDLS